MPVMGKENLEKASNWGWADSGLRSGCLLENPQARSVEIFASLLGDQMHKRKGDLGQELWRSCLLPSPCPQVSLPLVFPSLSLPSQHTFGISDLRLYTPSLIHSSNIHWVPTKCQTRVTQMNLIPILSSGSSQSSSPLLISPLVKRALNKLLTLRK